MVWGCFAGDTVCITLNQHGYHSILQLYAIPSGLRLVGLSFTKKESDGVWHRMTWPLQSLDLNQIEMVWDESDHRVKEKQPTSAQHLWELLQD